jgi:hypothetical protein
MGTGGVSHPFNGAFLLPNSLVLRGKPLIDVLCSLARDYSGVRSS